MNTNTEENNPETNLQWVKGQLIKNLPETYATI